MVHVNHLFGQSKRSEHSTPMIVWWMQEARAILERSVMKDILKKGVMRSLRNNTIADW